MGKRKGIQIYQMYHFRWQHQSKSVSCGVKLTFMSCDVAVNEEKQQSPPQSILGSSSLSSPQTQ